jgi:SNF family Na+-dependent transporter
MNQNSDKGPTVFSRSRSVIHSGVKAMQLIISVILALLATIFFWWINGKQHEYEELNKSSKKD